MCVKPVDDPDKLEFTFGEIAEEIANELKEINFTYQSGSDYQAKCYYTNDYFAESSYKYNASLSTMSLAFAMSAFGSSEGGQENYVNKSKNAKQLLQDIGMPPEGIETNDWFTEKPAMDSIGVIIGNMPITVKREKYTLIAIAVRGGGYEQEWASNFTIGATGQHDGFNEAKKNVIEYLRTYISEHNISGPVKIWITGYKRAAATANLVGGDVDSGITLGENISYSLNDVYTYCFETPAGAITSQVKRKSEYNNIFNIINSSDPVPYVAPATLGFGRYGIDKDLPSAESNSNYYALRTKMLKFYNSLPSTDSYIIDSFQMKKLGVDIDIDWDWFNTKVNTSFVLDDSRNNYSQGVFLSNYVTILAKDFIRSRNYYITYYEDEIREICSVVFGCTDEQFDKLMKSIVSQAKEQWGSLAWSYVYNVGIKGLWGAGDVPIRLSRQIIRSWFVLTYCLKIYA